MLTPQLERDLHDFPALVLQGARAVGKTTLGRALAASEINLADKAQHSFFAADPVAALREAEKPVLLDEWQIEPDCLCGNAARRIGTLLTRCGEHGITARHSSCGPTTRRRTV